MLLRRRPPRPAHRHSTGSSPQIRDPMTLGDELVRRGRRTSAPSRSSSIGDSRPHRSAPAGCAQSSSPPRWPPSAGITSGDRQRDLVAGATSARLLDGDRRPPAPASRRGETAGLVLQALAEATPSPPSGTVLEVDAGAARALRESEAHRCCRSAIVAVHGGLPTPATRSRSWESGAGALGKGVITNYAAAELGQDRRA